uniref:Uncharacterized protein n=1 Tax=Cyanothece sp. (strain PCC 7425 / ATCC 29141) TaxID=395961 RepID=B8HK75_CYAP4
MLDCSEKSRAKPGVELIPELINIELKRFRATDAYQTGTEPLNPNFRVITLKGKLVKKNAHFSLILVSFP